MRTTAASTESPQFGTKEITSSLVPAGGALGSPFPATDGSPSAQLRHLAGWVFVCVRAIAQRIAGQPVRVARAGGKMRSMKQAVKQLTVGDPFSRKAVYDTLKPLDSHPFLDLVDDPNDAMQWSNLVFSWVASLQCSGRGVLLFGDDADEVWPLPTHWLTPYHSPTPYAYWRVQPSYQAENLIVPGDLMAHAHFADPANPFGVISPLQACAAAVSADHAIQHSQAAAFERGIFPGLAIVAGDADGVDAPGVRPSLDEAQRQQIITAIKDRYGGFTKNGEPLILDALISDIKQISTTPNEMDWLNSSGLTKERIMQTFGVNPIIVGQVEASSRAASAEADRHFCNSTVNPLIELLSQVLTGWAGPLFGGGEKLVIWIEPCHPRDGEELRANLETLSRIGGLTANEARSMLMGLPPLPGGDVPLVPFSLVPRDAGDDVPTDDSGGD